MMRTLTLTVAALVAFGGTSAMAQTTERAPAGDLKWNLKAGDTHHYAFSWSLGLKVRIAPPPGMGGPGGQMMDVGGQDVNLGLTLTQKVTKVDGDKASIEATITSVQCDFTQTSAMGMGGSKAKYDSASPDGADDVLKTLKLVVGKKLTYTIDTQGQVTNLTGASTLQTQIQAEAQRVIQEKMQNAPRGGGGGGGFGGGGMMGGMQGMGGAGAMGFVSIAFGDKSLGSLLNALTHVLPAGAKAQGEEWSHDVTQNLPPMGSIKLKAKFKHAGEADGKTKITFEPDGEIKLERGKADPNDPLGAMRAKMFGKQKVKKSSYKGWSTFSGGAIVESQIDETMETLGELNVPQGMGGGGQVPQGMKMGLKVKVSLHYQKKSGPPTIKKKTQSDF